MYEEILSRTAHRPFPVAKGPWVAFQSWRRQLFAHWPVEPEGLRGLVPTGLEIDTYEGRAWVTATPFEICRFHARGLPPLPPVSEYLELNLRTYVTREGIPGVWFFSLDSSSRTATAGARTFYRLPYFNARMSLEQEGNTIHFESRREDGTAGFSARYEPSGPPALAEPGSLEYFLVERYLLYARLHRGGLLCAHIHHGPWLLQPAEAHVDAVELLRAGGIEETSPPVLMHYTARQDTLVWGPEAA